MYRTNYHYSSGSVKGSTESFQDEALEHAFNGGPPSPMFYGGPPSRYSSNLSGRQYSPAADRRRVQGRFSPHGMEHARPWPAFQYSDSDRSDSSTKPSSISSSYANSEDFTDNGESLRFVEIDGRNPYNRRIGSSWDSLNATNNSRSPSPRPSGSRSAGQSSESLYSDHDSYSPNSPGFGQRSFSFASTLPHPEHLGRPKVRYMSDLGIVSNSGQAGSYSVTHMGSARTEPQAQLGKGFMSTSLSTITRSSAPNSALRSVRSHVDMAMPYLTNPGLYRAYHSSKASFNEQLLEWEGDEEQEATLV